MLEKGRAASKREGRARAADRPRWWAVLAVTLALMALVASVTTAAHRGHGKAAHGQESSAATTLPVVADGTATSTTTTDAGQADSASHSSVTVGGSPAAVADSSSGTAPAAGTKATQQSQSGSSSPTGTRTTTADAPSVAAATTTTAGTSTGGPTRSEDPGFLAYPGDISASYPVSAVGKASATATWSGTPDLTLSITCPGREDQRTGTSGLSVTVGAAATGSDSSTCAVVIAEPQGTQATVSYTLVIVATAT